jgi:hypothetical protein
MLGTMPSVSLAPSWHVQGQGYLFRRYLTTEMIEAVCTFSEMCVNKCEFVTFENLLSLMILIYRLSRKYVRVACVPYFLPHKTLKVI